MQASCQIAMLQIPLWPWRPTNNLKRVNEKWLQYLQPHMCAQGIATLLIKLYCKMLTSGKIMVYRKSDKLMVVLYSCMTVTIMVKNSKVAELDKRSKW